MNIKKQQIQVYTVISNLILLMPLLLSSTIFHPQAFDYVSWHSSQWANGETIASLVFMVLIIPPAVLACEYIWVDLLWGKEGFLRGYSKNLFIWSKKNFISKAFATLLQLFMLMNLWTPSISTDFSIAIVLYMISSIIVYSIFLKNRELSIFEKRSHFSLQYLLFLLILNAIITIFVQYCLKAIRPVPIPLKLWRSVLVTGAINMLGLYVNDLAHASTPQI